MSKRWISFLVLLATCGLVACRSGTTPALEPTATAERAQAATATQVQAPTATATLATQSSPTPVPTVRQTGASKPDPTPTPAWQIPGIRETDWTKGSDDAGLVIVEYSDFQ